MAELPHHSRSSDRRRLCRFARSWPDLTVHVDGRPERSVTGNRVEAGVVAASRDEPVAVASQHRTHLASAVVPNELTLPKRRTNGRICCWGVCA